MAIKKSTKKVVSDNVATGNNEITLRESIFPLFLVTILFFLWGFAYGLLDVLNKHFQEVLHITRSQSSGLQGAYFGAYFLGPLTFSGYILRRWGYRVAFMTGLCIYGVGALMFWPSGMKESFGGFCGSMFIVGCGLSTLETAANPYISVLGPPKYLEMRLNLAQAVQGMGTVLAPVLASHVFFKSVSDSALQSVQWVYLAIACFVFFLAVVFYFAPLPEITDADMETQAQDDAAEGTETTSSKPIWQQKTLIWGVLAQFCYVGSQCAVAGFFINYVTEAKPGLSSAEGSNFLSIAQAGFAIGRFIAGFSMKFVKPRHILFVFLAGCVAFAAACIKGEGNTAVALIHLVLFFESCCFPTIFSLSLRGLGRHTKRGASFLVASVCGGAVFPPMMAVVSDSRNSTKFGMIVPMAGFIAAFSFPIYLNLFEAERLDSYSKSTVGLDNKMSDSEKLGIDSDKGTEEIRVEKL
ncbi:putative L-fucose-proton symporter [Morchella conica CCBAS932]|uniref:Putative L-fucose-proton symporter n=1 Tax=Morchella conica CCBAS932 TaxID=1392247 RepID=A0A3N4KE00_9PEZI|nr:putative L-fucose-proton symporter [Morchella conica CCBAS932]